jgi:uncharacterized protein
VTIPISYLELNSPDLRSTARFFEDVFSWELQPFAVPDYLVAPHGTAPGVDCGMLPSRDGAPRAVPIIRVDSIDAVRPVLEAAGGTVVVEPFSFPGVGWGCYCTDPAGVLFGLHEYEPAEQ